jgi:hypothetical protein
MRTLLRTTTVGIFRSIILCSVIIAVILAKGPIAETQPNQSESNLRADSTDPADVASPEILNVGTVTCGKYPTRNRWIPVTVQPETTKITPLTHVFRKKSKILKAAGKIQEARQLKWKLTRQQRKCRTIVSSSANGPTNNSDTTPVPPTLTPIDSPTTTPPAIPTLAPTPLPDVPMPQVAPGSFSFSLIDACANRAVLGLSSEWAAQRNRVPFSYSIRANAESGVQSVRFSYNGFSELDNSPPFSLFGDRSQNNIVDYLPGELPLGRTLLEVKGYASPDGAGLPIATALLTINMQPNPSDPTAMLLDQIPTLTLPPELTSVSRFEMDPSGCVALEGLNDEGAPAAFQLIDETQSWMAITATQSIDDSTGVAEGYQKIASSNSTALLTYQKEPYECGWNGLSTLIAGALTDSTSPFTGCVSIEQAVAISGGDNFGLLGTAFTYAEDTDPVATLHLARVQGNGTPIWKTVLPFTLLSTFNVHNIAYIPTSSTAALKSEGLFAVLLSVGDDPSGPVLPTPLLPGTNVLFIDALSGIITRNQFFPAAEEPLRVAGLGYNAYGLLSLRSSMGGAEPTQSIVVRVVR